MFYYVADVCVCVSSICISIYVYESENVSCSVLSNSLWSHGLYSLCPRDSPGKNTGLGSHSLLQGIFLTQGSNPGLLAWLAESLPSESARRYTCIYVCVCVYIYIYTHSIKWASLCEVAWYKGIRAYLRLQVFYPERWLSMKRQTPHKQRMLVEIVYWLPKSLLIKSVKQSE